MQQNSESASKASPGSRSLAPIAALDAGQIRLLEDWPDSELSNTLAPAFEGQDPGELASPMMPQTDRLRAGKLYLAHLQDAYLVFLPGLDGVVLTSEGRVVAETAHFAGDRTPIEDFDTVRRQAVDLKASVFVSIDCAWFNYYHFICFGLGKCGLAAPYLAPEDEFVFPDFTAHTGTAVTPRYSEDVWRGVLSLLPAGRKFRRLQAGIYKFSNLRLLVTDRAEPTHLTQMSSFYSPFRILPKPDKTATGGALLVLRSSVPRLSPELSQGLQQIAVARGYRVLRLEHLSFAEQMEAFATAERVVAPHGAGLTNILFGSSHLNILELNSPQEEGQRFLRPWFYFLAHGMGQSYRYVDVSASDMTLDKLESILDRFEAAAHERSRRSAPPAPRSWLQKLFGRYKASCALFKV